MKAGTKAGALPSFVKQRLDPEQRYGLRVTLFALAVIVVFVPFGILLTQVVDEGPLTRYDRSVAENLHDVFGVHRWALPVLELLSFIGKPIWFYIIVGAACAYLLWRGRRRLTAFLIATGFGGGFVDTAVKVIVSRDRPKLDQPFATAFGQSFPSGHAFTSTAIYGALLLAFMPVIPRRLRGTAIGLYVALVCAIAFSRLALGVHYVTDVIGGILLGAAWLVASAAAFSIWRTERGRQPVQPKRGLEPEAKKDLSVHES
jgi:membrane-associated phospholipid phosphatase